MKRFNLTLENNSDRRHREEEKWQKQRLNRLLKEIANELDLSLDLGWWDASGYGTSKKAMIITEDGLLMKASEIGRGKSKKGRDSKAFDAIATLSNKVKTLNVFFFCKYTKERGGNQDSIMYEVVKTTDNIAKNNSDDNLFFFLMEGDRWDGNEELQNDRGFSDKATLLPTNGDDNEIKKEIKHSIIKYFNN